MRDLEFDNPAELVLWIKLGLPLQFRVTAAEAPDTVRRKGWQDVRDSWPEPDDTIEEAIKRCWPNNRFRKKPP